MSMRVTCTQQDLNKGLSNVFHAVPTRNTLPILANILLETDGDRLRVSATNLEIGITCYVEATVHEEGSTTVPAKTFVDLIGNVQGQIDLTVTEKEHFETHEKLPMINVKTKKSNANLHGMAPAEFPQIPGPQGEEISVSLDAQVLKTMINESVFAASREDARPVFTGVFVEATGERLTLAAADTFRLAVRVEPLPGLEETFENFIVPATTLDQLSRILPNEGVVHMMVSANNSQVIFYTESLTLVSRLIEGTFPNFKGVVPKAYITRLVVDKNELIAAVRAIMPFARANSTTRLKVSSGNDNGVKNGMLTIEGVAQDVGDNTCDVDAEVDGPDQVVVANIGYLFDVLDVIDAPQVALELTSGVRPFIVEPVNAVDYRYIIMPMIN